MKLRFEKLKQSKLVLNWCSIISSTFFFSIPRALMLKISPVRGKNFPTKLKKKTKDRWRGEAFELACLRLL